MQNKYIWQFMLLLALTLLTFGIYSFSDKIFTLADIFPDTYKNISEVKIQDDVIQLSDSLKSMEHRHKVNDVFYNVLSADIQKAEIKEVFEDVSVKNENPSKKNSEFLKDTVNEAFRNKGLTLSPVLDSLMRTSLFKKTKDTSSQKILIIGDSMLEGLSLRLQDYSEHNGHEMQAVIWYSSQSLWFGKSDTLKHFIEKFNPTYVILVLGANELFVPKIIERRKKYVEKIISQLDSVKFVWVGPPNWKDDTGINKLIVDAVGWDRYFPSKNLKYRRTKDGAHPTYESAAVWMDSIASWLCNYSKYPIKMEKPEHKRKKSPKRIILSPWK